MQLYTKCAAFCKSKISLFCLVIQKQETCLSGQDLLLKVAFFGKSRIFGKKLY